MIIALPVFSKAVIITYDYCMRMKFFKQKVCNIFFSGLMCKFFVEGNYHQMVNTFFFKQVNFFFKCIEYKNFFSRNNFSWMRMKSDDNRFSIYRSSLLF